MLYVKEFDPSPHGKGGLSFKNKEGIWNTLLDEMFAY